MTYYPFKWDFYRFKIEEDYIVLDINSSQFKLIDEKVYAALSEVNRYNKDEFKEYITRQYGKETCEKVVVELNRWFSEGFVTKPDSRIIERINYKKPEIQLMYLNIVHDCDLKCRYCFASQGDYNMGKTYMKKETAFKAVDYLLENAIQNKPVDLRFFGGEPLLNFNLLKETTEYGKKRSAELGVQLNFSIFTNGFKLTKDISDYFKANNFDLFISIDGPAEVHDQTRPTLDGTGSHETIVQNVKEFMSGHSGRFVSARVVLTPKYLDLVSIVNHIIDIGIWKVMWGPCWGFGDEEYTFSINDLNRLKKEIRRLALAYIKHISSGSKKYIGVKPVGSFVFKQLYEENKDVYYCIAGRKSVTVTTEGDLYPCFQFIGLDQYKMGNIYEGIDNEIQKKFIDAHVLNKEKCCGCWARFLCAGGCLAQSYQENQDLNEPATQHCFVSRENLKWSMYVYSKLERDYPNVLSQLKRIGKIRDAMHTDKLFEEELETKIKLTDEI